MPGVIEAITFLVIAAQAGALGSGLIAVFGSSAFLTTALSVGLSLLSSVLFRPKQPKPEDVQTSVKNPTAPRQRHYGRVKTSGPWVFCDSNDGKLHKLIALGTGELDEIEEFWVDDNLVTIDIDGRVDQEPYDGDLFIEYRLGLETETHYSNLEAAFPEWTSDHVGNGVSSLYAVQDPTPQEKLSERFPNLSNTNYRVVARGSKVFSLSTDSPPDSPAALTWTDNAASIIRDYMSHADGMRFPEALFTTPLASAGWIAAYARCAEPVTLKAGGTEPRYRLWGSYTFDERPADVLGRMLASCDGRIIPTPDGGVTLDIGTWAEPTVVIDEDAIVGFSDVSRGRDIQATANTIRATFLSPFHDYQSTDADPWVDDDDVSLRGEISTDRSFNMAPSHGQARRLMKLDAYRAKPSWTGTFQCNLRAMAAFGQRFIRITYPLFEIDEVFELIDFRFIIGEGNILQGVTLTVYSMPEEAYEWDAATEEGDAPLAEEVTVDRTIPEPANFTFTEDIIVVSGQAFSVGVLSFDAPPAASLRVQGRYKRTADTAWIVVAIGDGETEGRTGALDDGEEYEAQVRHVTMTGRVGDWTASETLTPISNPTPPVALVAATAVGGMGNAVLTVTAAADPNLAKLNIYRVAAGGTLDKNTDPLVTTSALPGLTFTAHIGDMTTVNMLENPGFDSDTLWTKGANWTIGSGVASKSGGGGNSLSQTDTYAAGSVYRYRIEIPTLSGGSLTPRLTGGTTVTGTAYTTTGTKYGSLTGAVGGNTAWGIIGATAAVGTVDNVVSFLETGSSIAQALYDLHVFAVNASGLESSTAVVVTNVQII